MDLSHLPILGICGPSGSGKTTLVEAALPPLLASGLSVAVAKACSVRLELDRPGKDSERLFQAGADIFWTSPSQAFQRTHPHTGPGWEDCLRGLLRRHDVLLVETHALQPFDCVRLDQGGEGEGGDLPSGPARLPAFLDHLTHWLAERWRRPQHVACVLIGGTSSRMGRPKHLIETEDGRTWLETIAGVLAGVADEVVVAGAGELPAACRLRRLVDAPGVDGPLAGLLAAFRWNPWANWIFAPCDVPCVTPEAVRWMVESRRPGRWAVLPESEPGRAEPLLACYDFRMGPVLEALHASGQTAIRPVLGHPKVDVVAVPDRFRSAWRNRNTPND